MRIWSENCGCDATLAHPYALCQLDGRFQSQDDIHGGEGVAIVQPWVMYTRQAME
jgi:hypothetical protein